MLKPKVIILRTAGTNCDYETQAAFELAGSQAERIHINRLISGEIKLSDYQILAIPGGFSYGDDIASGKILANELKYKLGEPLKEFASAGKPIIGICNGFQVLVKMGLLPGSAISPFSKGGSKGDYLPSAAIQQTTILTLDDSDKFECRWIHLKTINNKQLTINNERQVKCIWVGNMPEIISLPVAHGEGKFVAMDKNVLAALEKNDQVVFRYSDREGKPAGYPLNPNGAVNEIAGICNQKGNVFGLMPRPERFVYLWQHPNRERASSKSEYGWGLQIFKNAVNFVQ